jgi:DNA-binding MarR family transcriptional regulator
MHLHLAKIKDILDCLESRTLAERIRSKDDRHVVKVQLTERGNILSQ